MDGKCRLDYCWQLIRWRAAELIAKCYKKGKMPVYEYCNSKNTKSHGFSTMQAPTITINFTHKKYEGLFVYQYNFNKTQIPFALWKTLCGFILP